MTIKSPVSLIYTKLYQVEVDHKVDIMPHYYCKLQYRMRASRINKISNWQPCYECRHPHI